MHVIRLWKRATFFRSFIYGGMCIPIPKFSAGHLFGPRAPWARFRASSISLLVDFFPPRRSAFILQSPSVTATLHQTREGKLVQLSMECGLMSRRQMLEFSPQLPRYGLASFHSLLQGLVFISEVKAETGKTAHLINFYLRRSLQV